MSEKFDNLTGRWTGRYDYVRDAAAVPFEAVLDDSGGVLSGDITEPNTFRRDMGTHLAATLIGDRRGHDVSFRKTYGGFDQGDDPIYEGELNDAMTRIDGVWRFPDAQEWLGRFMMVRIVELRMKRSVADEVPF